MKYKTKPIVIDAFRFRIDKSMPDWFADKVSSNDVILYSDGRCDVVTLEGIMKADYGDYIIKGIQGELYPCKPEIFEKTYEKLEE